MAYADELVRVTVTWRPPPADTSWAGEQAVTTFHLRHHHQEGNSFDWAHEMGHLPGQLHAKYVAHWGGDFGFTIASGAIISQFKTAHIDALGHVLQEGAYDVLDGSLTGSGGANMLPPEVALCVSAWAYEPGTFAAQKGRKRGRFYLPYISTAHCNSQGRVVAGDGSALAIAMQALFNDIQGMHIDAAPTPPNDADYWDFVVASKVDASWHNVDFISVDDKFDSQRRRQHQAGATRWVETISHA